MIAIDFVAVPPTPTFAALGSSARVLVIGDPSSVQRVGKWLASTLPTRRVPCADAPAASAAAKPATGIPAARFPNACMKL